jgi:hypothetical protein
VAFVTRLLLTLIPLLGISNAAGSGCLTAEVETQPIEAAGKLLYRLEFRNSCVESRTLFWCAEHSSVAVPHEVACPTRQSSLGLPAEPTYPISRRRSFQWLLPFGTQIRYHDCPSTERPTLGFGCAAAF